MRQRASHKRIPEELTGLTVREDALGQRLTIQKKTMIKGLTAFFGVFSFFWNAVTWGILIFESDKAPHFLYVSHVPIGLVTAYVFLALLLNTQTLTATKGNVEIKSKPLPWLGNMKFQAQNLRGFTTRRYHAYSQNHRPVYMFKVIAVKNDFQSEDIFKGLQTREHALKVEELLEKFFRIEDDLNQDEAEKKIANL